MLRLVHLPLRHLLVLRLPPRCALVCPILPSLLCLVGLLDLHVGALGVRRASSAPIADRTKPLVQNAKSQLFPELFSARFIRKCRRWEVRCISCCFSCLKACLRNAVDHGRSSLSMPWLAPKRSLVRPVNSTSGFLLVDSLLS